MYVRRVALATRRSSPRPGAYYAAQQGIALKLKDSAARHFLFDLLGLLERMKTDIGPNDAVHDEPASAAYVENFALQVFAGADKEDMSGNVTRCVPISTALIAPANAPICTGIPRGSSLLRLISSKSFAPSIPTRQS